VLAETQNAAVAAAADHRIPPTVYHRRRRAPRVGHAVPIRSTRGLSREEWWATQCSGIGSSDVPAILGLSPWSTPLQVWLWKTGREGPAPQNEAMVIGQALEDPVARLWTRRTGNRVRRVQSFLAHPERRWQIALLDRVTSHDPLEIVEIKVSGRAEDWRGGDLPPAYWAQVQHQLAVTGLRRARLVALVGTRLEERLIEAVPSWQEDLRELEWEFWRHVEEDTPPPATAADLSVLPRAYPGVDGRTLEAPPEVVDLVAQLREQRLLLARIQSEVERLQAEIEATMGDATNLVAGGHLLATWRPVERRTLDSKRLREELPEVWERYAQVQRTRVFRLMGGAESGD
jgi:putative phage-type endonuclease